MDFSQIQSDSELYLMNTYNKFSVSLEKGKNATIWDVDGKEYIDFTSGIGVNSLGHSNPIITKAITEQSSKILHMSNLYYNSIQARTAKKLVEISGMNKVFFANSGAEANECAIKLARKYSSDKYVKDRTDILTLKNSFHGRTVTTLSATGQEAMHKYFYPFTEGFVYAEANNVSDVESKITDNTCAVMIELIQGEGGVLPLDCEFVKFLANICSNKDILLIIDEVQTGIARTGTMFCYEQYNIKPDVVTLAKGLGGGVPIGATLCSEKTLATMSASTHGSTFGGNPLACAVAGAVIEETSNEEFLRSVCEKGDYLRSKISDIKGVTAVRGKGLMIGFDVNGMLSSDILQKCLDRGLLVLLAKQSVRLLPPLTISYEELDKGINILSEVIA